MSRLMPGRRFMQGLMVRPRSRRTAMVVSTLTLAALATAKPAFGQAAPPAPASSLYVIDGARVVTLAGPAIEAGSVVVRDGQIVAVGATVTVPAGAQRIDGKGLHVYPGLFDAITELGLTEFGSVSATVDTNEIGPYSPQIVAATAVHPASEHLPVARADGITHALAVPGLSSGGGFGSGNAAVVGGQASAIHLTGWTVEEMLIRRSVGLVVNWPRLSTASFDVTTFSPRSRPFTEVKQEYDKRVTELGEWFEKARRYQLAIAKAPAATERDLKLEALVPVLTGERPLLVKASSARQIKDAVAFATERRLKLVLLGAADARQALEVLVKHAVPVIVGPSQALPEHEDDPYDAPYALAGDLHKAGVKVSISTFSSSSSRTLPFEAGHAVGYGLPWEEALRAITINPAQALGLSDRIGTIEPGKIANLIVTSGDPLEIATTVRYVFINGRPVSLANRHRDSYERWKSRPLPAPTR
jgi:imidazolonepropionase-like amidohydrolase